MINFQTIKQHVGIAIGAGIVSFGVNAFNITNHLAEGGVTGISILLKLGLDIEPGLTVLVLNIPLLAWGVISLGWRASWRSVYGVGVLSLFLKLTSGIQMPLDDMLLAAIYAGVAVGLGLGIVFRYGGTTGGVDIMVRILHKRLGWRPGRVMFGCDIVVLAISAVYLDIHQIMYTLIALFIGAHLIDLVESGAYSAKGMFIMTDKSKEVSEEIFTSSERRVSVLKTVGQDNEEGKDVFYLVCPHTQAVRLKAAIRSIDPAAVVALNDVEVAGKLKH